MTGANGQDRVVTHSLGQVIRRRRSELGITQEELAERVGGNMRQSDISRLERGRIGLPRRGRLEAIANALQVTPGYLLLHSGWAQEGFVLPGAAPHPEVADAAETHTDGEIEAPATPLAEPDASDLMRAVARARELARRTDELLRASDETGIPPQRPAEE